MPKGLQGKSSSGSLGTIGEFEFIHTIQERFGFVQSPIIHGIGDDAAVLRPQAGDDLLVSTDLLTEDIHFTLNLHSFKEIGYRAAIANLSDIAAMGGVPQALLIGLAIPPQLSKQHLIELYQGLMKPCQKHSVALIGGDTSKSNSGLFLSITVLGKINHGHSLTRSGAKVTDHIYVTGTLGDSAAGLQLLKHFQESRPGIKKKKSEALLIKRHLHPIPRLDVGQQLSRNKLAHAAIDLSDGLSGDFRHVCQASQVGAELWEEHIPISPECQAFAYDHGKLPLDMALGGGEDFELLFTAPARHRQRVEAISKSSKVPISCIGRIHSKEFGIRLKLADGSSRKVIVNSFNHFTNITSLDREDL